MNYINQLGKFCALFTLILLSAQVNAQIDTVIVDNDNGYIIFDTDTVQLEMGWIASLTPEQLENVPWDLIEWNFGNGNGNWGNGNWGNGNWGNWNWDSVHWDTIGWHDNWGNWNWDSVHWDTIGWNDNWGNWNWDSLGMDTTIIVDGDTLIFGDGFLNPWEGFLNNGHWQGYYGSCSFNGGLVMEDESGYDLTEAVIIVYNEYGDVVAILNPEEDGSFNVEGLAEGNYTIVVSYASYNFNSASLNFTTEDEEINNVEVAQLVAPTNLENYELADFIHLYPNPVNKMLVFDLSAVNFTVSTIEITNLEGKVIQQIDFESNAVNQVNLSSLNSGTYFLSIISDKQRISKQFIKL